MRDEAFGRLEEELHRERAAALGRIGRTLEELIGRLQALRHRAGLASQTEREELTAEYQVVRQRAALYRWYLEVQRESVGLRRHERLDDMYPLPPRDLISAADDDRPTGE